MSIKCKKLGLGVALSFVLSASAFAATVNSTPTPTVKGRAPVAVAPTIDHNDVNGNGFVDAGIS